MVYKFLNENSELHYQKVLNSIKTDFPNAISSEDVQAIETGIFQIENGMMPISVNGRQFTAKQIFKLVSEAGYFGREDEAQKFFAEIAQMPLVYNIFWFQFKSFTFNAFKIVFVIFDLIRLIENNPEYKTKLKPEESNLRKCIYCLTETGTFDSEEHIIPESLVGDEIYPPKGFVCDACNNGISSKLDEALINFEPIAFVRVQFTPHTKAGKFPKANFQNMVMEKTNPNHIKITAKDRTGEIKNKRILEDGNHAFDLNWKGKKLDWKTYARAIYKFALGFVAHDMGHEAALENRYQPARDFILKGTFFNNNMLVSTKSKPHPEVRTLCDMQFGGTPFYIDIFGMMFMINLEETLLLYKNEEMTKFMQEIFERYQFEFVSLI